VTVVGEVQHPTSHFFKPMKAVEDYVDNSGGYNEMADKHRVYVVKANGQVILPEKSRWFRADSQETLEAGDTIVVPMETDKFDHLTIWATVTQVISNMALGIAAINSL